MDDEELQMALERHREVGGSLADVIVEMGLLSERRIAQAIEEAFGISLVDLAEMEIPPKVLSLIPAEKAQSLGAIPFALDEESGVLRVAFLNPLDTLTLEEVEDLTGLVVEPYQTTRSAFQYALARSYPELGLPVPPPPKGASPEEVRLGEYLVQKGLLDPKTLEEALVEQERTGDLLGRILVRKDLPEEALYRALAEKEGLEFLRSTDGLNPEPKALALLLRSDALRYQAIPVRIGPDGKVEVVLADPRHRQAVDRIVDVFPESEKELVRIQLANILVAVLAQQLLPKAFGGGRVLAYELMIGTPAVRALIREGKTAQLRSVIQTGGQYGMVTMDAVLANLYKRKLITYELGLSKAVDPKEFAQLAGAGEKATGRI